MADQIIAFDPEADEGERLAPEVRTEIAFIAPSAVLNDSITTAKLHDEAVTQGKLAPGAVGTVQIATGGVDSVNLADSAVTTDKLADAAVTSAKCGTGVVTAQDSAGSVTTVTVVCLTSAQYGALSPDPNTLYFIS